MCLQLENPYLGRDFMSGAEGIRTPDPLTASPKAPIPTRHGPSSSITGSKPLPGGLLRHDPSPSQQVTSGFHIDSGQIVDTNLSDVVYVDRCSSLLHECFD